MTEEEDHLTVNLPRGLSRRIETAVNDEALGYATFDDFVYAALRRELERAERTSYFLREGRR